MKDPVPHVPAQSFLGLDYEHAPQEIWQTSNSPVTLKTCSTTNGEDPNCSDSTPFWGFDVLDHALYMGHNALDGIPYGCLYTDSFARSAIKYTKKVVSKKK